MPIQPPSTDGYLSRNKEHLAAMQRKRRAGRVRIDYMPSSDSLAVVEAKRAQLPPRSVLVTNSAVLDAIINEWAQLTGIKKAEVEQSMTSIKAPGTNGHHRAHAYDFGQQLPPWAADWLARERPTRTPRRVLCGARRRRDGLPCRARSETGKRRCKWHGGLSTGPRTPKGKALALANLKQNRPLTEDH